MMLGVAVGIKSKLCALILVILLFIENMFFNGFWMEHSHSATYDFKKYVGTPAATATPPAQLQPPVMVLTRAGLCKRGG